MNALVLGGNGFIGSHLVDKLLAEKYDVTVFDRNKELFRKPLKNVKYIFADFGNRKELSDALDGIDIVFHLISTTHPKTSNDDPVFDVTSNVVETLFLLNECVRKKISKIVYVSSGGVVYGNPQKLPIAESYISNPLCSYGITKLTIENYILLYKHLYGLNYSIVRPSNAYGERQNPISSQGVISVFIKNILDKKAINIWGDGSVVRDYVFVQDLVSGIFAASIENKSDIFNIGGGEGYSINDIVQLLKEITQVNFEIVYKSSRNFDVPKIYLDISKAQKILEWNPKISLKEGVKLTWSFLKSIYS